MKLLIFFTFILSSNVFACHDTRCSKFFGDYQVVILHTNEWMVGEIHVYKNKKKVYEYTEWGQHFYFGNHFYGPKHPEISKDLYSGKDINKDGSSNLVITSWNGGAHCCNSLYIFEFEPNFRKIAQIDGGSYGFEFKDFNNDGVLEIEFWDWPIDYVFNCFAESAQGRTVLRYYKNWYIVDTYQMVQNKPTDVQIAKMIKNIKKEVRENPNGNPPSLMELMMQLSYSGYFYQATNIASEIWPKNKKGFTEFIYEFKSHLDESEYFVQLKRDLGIIDFDIENKKD